MKSKLIPLLVAAALIGLVIASAPRAQVAITPRVAEAEWQEVRLLPGEEILLHMSYDSAIDIVVDRPFTEKEKVLLLDAATGKKYPLPNGSAVRAQGNVQVSRAANADDAVETLIRWRPADTMFSFSRTAYPKPRS